MAFGLNKRRIKKAMHRLRYLPSGMDFFRYTANKVHAASLRALGSTKVAHPSSIMLEVTNHCNLKCITCPREYQYGDEMDKGFMPIDELKKIVDNTWPYVDSIGLTGLGETLLYKPITEAVDYIRSKSKGIIISISINAHLPKSVEIVEQLVGKIDTIQISMDGVGRTYEDVRLRSNYETFYENSRRIAELCKGSGTDLMFNFVAIKENYFTMAEVVHEAGKLGVPYVNITPFNVASVTAHHIDYYDFFLTDDFKAELARVKEEADNWPGVELSLWDFESEKGFRKCHLPWSHFYISWDGWSTPCCAKPFPKELNFGNVYEEGLLSCLNKPEYRQFRQMWYENKTPEFCKKCHMIDMKSVELEFKASVN